MSSTRKKLATWALKALDTSPFPESKKVRLAGWISKKGAPGRRPIWRPHYIERRAFDVETIRRMNDPRSVLIVTHQKAGTHLLRYFFVNYLLLLDDRGAAPATFEDVQRVMPNMRDYVVWRGREAKRNYDFERHGISDLMHTHVKDDVRRADEVHHLGRQIHCVRNPLDFIISIWHYNYLQRKEASKADTPLSGVLDHEARKWASQVSYMRGLASARPDLVLSLTYEELKESASRELGKAVRFTGIPFDEALVAEAAQRGALKRVRKEEEERGKPIVSDIRGRFTRDGSVGQWKKFMTPAQVERVGNIIAEYGLSLEEFVVESAASS